MELKSFTKKKNDKRIFLFLIGIFTLFNLSAQTSGRNRITGTVIESGTKEPVISASVTVKGTTIGTVTDVDGNYQIDVPANSTLVFSFIGFKAVEIPVANQKTINISLEEDVEYLNEVIVIGYGQVKKGDATGSLTSLKPDELNKGLQVTAEDALVGKIAGVNIVPGSGAPGSAGTIRIRMGASLSASNDPLIVIDGVPISDPSSAPLNSINPNDIETYTVLKDASATAIYGSRASNGVIIITTKKGASGISKPRVNYSANFTVSHRYKKYDVLSADEYRDIFYDKSSAPVDYKLGTANTDWQDEVYRTAFGTDHNISVTGNTNNIPYRISAGYTNQNGILLENNYERFNAGFGLSPKFFDNHLSVDINVKGTLENDRTVDTGIISTAIGFDPTRPVHQTYPNDMGLGYYIWTDGQGTYLPQAPSNPVADLKLNDRMNKTKRSIGNAAFNYKIHGFEDLQLNLNLGYDVRNREKEEITPDKAPATYVSIKSDGTGKYYWQRNKNTNYVISTYANYIKDLAPKHNINAMAGYEWQRFWYSDDYETRIEGMPDNSEPDKDVLYLISFFGRLNYSFDNKLLVTATFRADGTSRFSSDNRWGYFPSVAAGYRLAEEEFFKNIKPLSDLKLRLSYGQTGQQDISTSSDKNYHPYLPIYTISTNASMYPFGNPWLNMYRPNGYDPNIKWETTSTYNLGIDYGFLNNRIYGSVDVFKRYTKDLLSLTAVAAGSNFTNAIYTNIGDMNSNGVELALNAVPVKNKDWEWSVSGNFTYSKSKIKKLSTIDSDDKYLKTGEISRREFQIYKVGEVPNTYFLLKQAYDDNGKPLEGQYIDKDGSITRANDDNTKYITGKSSRVPYYYGLSTRVNYKNWDFGINGHGSFGNYIFNYQEAKQSYASLYGEQTSSNISRKALERGFKKEDYFTDMFLESGAFFKIDNITLGYTIPKLWNTSSALRLAFSAQNVATITKYSGVDPEIYNGLDNNTYQRPRIYTLSLNLNF